MENAEKTNKIQELLTTKNLVRAWLFTVLFVAGMIHLLFPEWLLPAMPPYIPIHYQLVVFTGFLELFFAFGLYSKEKKYRNSMFLIAYFVAILPAHFHVALNGIPMFGIESTSLLWARIPFQAVFIYAAWYLRR